MTTTVHVSSLQQRAASSSSSHININSNNNRSTKGAFESCFAQGLDLSEFDSTRVETTTTSITTPSPTSSSTSLLCASAQLLPVIQRLAQERQYNDQEELRLQRTIQARALHIQNETNVTLALPENSTSIWKSCELTNALVSMHDNDQYGAIKSGSTTKSHPKKKQNNNQTSNKGMKAKQQLGPGIKLQRRPTSHHSKKTAPIAKKAIRAKYH